MVSSRAVLHIVETGSGRSLQDSAARAMMFSMTLADAWARLATPWRESFQLAWDAFGAETVPVGAVVVDEAGAVVARGRNRIFEDEAPPGQLGGTRIAHAEVNALAQLPAGQRYDEYTLFTTIEPCVLCIGAASIATIRRIEYAGPDIYSGGGSLVTAAFAIPRGLDVEISGPIGGPLESFAEALHLAFFLGRASERHGLRTTYEQQRPDLVPLARALLGLRPLPLATALASEPAQMAAAPARLG
jgi:tRNA(adenine34) deaminase